MQNSFGKSKTAYTLEQHILRIDNPSRMRTLHAKIAKFLSDYRSVLWTLENTSYANYRHITGIAGIVVGHYTDAAKALTKRYPELDGFLMSVVTAERREFWRRLETRYESIGISPLSKRNLTRKDVSKHYRNRRTEDTVIMTTPPVDGDGWRRRVSECPWDDVAQLDRRPQPLIWKISKPGDIPLPTVAELNELRRRLQRLPHHSRTEDRDARRTNESNS